MNEEIEKVLKDIQQRLESIESSVQLTHPRNGYFTILGFAQMAGRHMYHELAVRMGKRAVVLSEKHGSVIGKLPDEKYGCVNLYHRVVLDDVFKEFFQQP